MIDIQKFPETWCRMWSEDATLAHELLTGEARQWATRTAALDGVVGPAQAEGFISRYQVDVGNIFVPRTLDVGTDLVAYTWDLTRARRLRRHRHGLQRPAVGQSRRQLDLRWALA